MPSHSSNTWIFIDKVFSAQSHLIVVVVVVVVVAGLVVAAADM